MKRCLSPAIPTIFILFAFFSWGCGPHRTPDLARIFAESRAVKGKRPLIIIPGILGSQLINSKTGEIVWPAAFRSAHDGLALPVSPELESNRDDLKPANIIDTMKLAKLVPEVWIYHQLLIALSDYGGYTEGKWDDPGSDGDRDKYYIFAYDWRRDNVENARLLLERIRTLKARLGRPDLKVNIVAHSMGGLIARYAAEYGTAELPAEGTPPRPTWAGAQDINKIMMFGTPNEGSTDAFVSLLHGYSITDGRHARVRFLNQLGPDEAFTAPALFELMPSPTSVRFLDRDLRPIAVDLYDPTNWKKYQWGAPGNSEFRRRFSSSSGARAMNNAESLEQLDSYLAATLSYAKRFHEAMDAPLDDNSAVTLFAFGGDCEDTLDAPVLFLDEKTHRWVTATAIRSINDSAGKSISKKDLGAAMYLPGDGRVTRKSLLAETLVGHRTGSPFVKAGLPFAYSVFACDVHGDLQNNKNLLDNALTALVAEAVK